MHVPRAPHRWAVTWKHARAIQQRLAPLVRQVPLDSAPRFVAGLDAAFSPDDRCCLAAAVVWDMREQAVIEQQVAVRRLTFPYVPGLLSFREAPAVLAALRKLRTEPDVLIYDGHGRAHPRRFGVACHVGVILNRPMIGCAKTRLIGTHRAPGWRRGSVAPLIDAGEVIGNVLRTQDGINPVFVSVGHRIDLTGAQQIILACAIRYRLPEPTRLADQLVGAAKRVRE
ncbi:MAG TPA: deoxyribonuclease V [Candidatus Margulisiibacteriota bacterium]|nr:deoxyribonuclease V [Candidatus Margulisiibacteriota bacterium]